MQLVMGTSAELRPTLVTQMARYRHKVFVERLGWPLRCENGLELDQFDRDDTIYVVAQNESAQVVGLARLLPTTRPYLLGDVFPQLLNGVEPPCADDVWELSRFAAVNFGGHAGTSAWQFSSEVAVELIRACLALAASAGVRQVVTVSPVGVERLLRSAEIRFHRAGPPCLVDGRPICALCIATDAAVEPQAPLQ